MAETVTTTATDDAAFSEVFGGGDTATDTEISAFADGEKPAASESLADDGQPADANAGEKPATNEQPADDLPPEMTPEWSEKLSALSALVFPAQPAKAEGVAAATAPAKADPGGTAPAAPAAEPVGLDAFKPVDVGALAKTLGYEPGDAEFAPVAALAEQQNNLIKFMGDTLKPFAAEVSKMREFYQQTQTFAQQQQEAYLNKQIDAVAGQNPYWTKVLGKSWSDANEAQRAARIKYAEGASNLVKAQKWGLDKVGDAFLAAILADKSMTRAGEKAANPVKPKPRTQPASPAPKANGGSVWDETDKEFGVA